MSEYDNWIDEAEGRARELGIEHGKNAAGWWIQYMLTQANDSRERAHMVLHMDDIGDPAINLPHADLSGQWGDGVKTQDVLDHALANGGWDSDYGDEVPGIADNQILDAYEDGFSQAARDECILACQNELAS